MRRGRHIFVAIAVLTAYLHAADIATLSNGFSIRHERRQVIGPTTRLFVDANGDSYVDVPTADISSIEKDLTPSQAKPAPAPSRAEISDTINSVSNNYHLDPDLVNSVIHAESGFNAHAVSRKGAQGLMQLMPQTASKLGVENAFDPTANVDGGSRYLRELIERYHFDLVKALAAYNAGPQRVEQYHGVPPYAETHAYVARIVSDYNRKKLAEQKAAKTAHAQTTHRTPPKNAVAANQKPALLNVSDNPN
ncbi:MAG TPA: lytic transglycosylase domain-containing protein [Terriglobales bacterium]